MKLKEIAVLPDQLYSDYKTKIKKLFKEHGLTFNQGALHTAQIFLWQSDIQQVEGKFTKNEEGITTRAELIITQKEQQTSLAIELKALVEELGGTWFTLDEAELQKEAHDELTAEIEAFESTMWMQLFNEERNARKQGMEHCPVIKPMITKSLKERFEKFGLENLTPYDVLAEVYATIDSEVSE